MFASASRGEGLGGRRVGQTVEVDDGQRRESGMVTGSTVLPVPRRIADGSVSAAMRSIVSAVMRTSSGTRTTFARLSSTPDGVLLMTVSSGWGGWQACGSRGTYP